jgi:hypothetical protein
VPAQCARGSLGDNKLGYLVLLCGDSRCFVYFPREEHPFPKRKAVGRRLILRASTRPSRSPYCSGATLRVRLCDALFSPRRLDLRKLASVTSPLDLPSVSVLTFLEGVLALPDSGQVAGSSDNNNNALSSLQAPEPTL